MMPHVMRRFGWLALLVAVGCVNLNVYVSFPAEEIRSALENMESDIRATGEPPSSWAPHERSWFAALIPVRISIGPARAYAQKPVDLEVETPTILSLKKQRKERFKQIDPYMEKGILGEGRLGYLIVREQADLDLKERGVIKRLVKEENDDRKAIYIEILTANNFPKDDLERVEKLAAEAIRKVLKPGRWYEVEKDKWDQKKKKESETEK
ncbi:MAG: DUF1318 domain-containing protein [bacterium]